MWILNCKTKCLYKVVPSLWAQTHKFWASADQWADRQQGDKSMPPIHKPHPPQPVYEESKHHRHPPNPPRYANMVRVHRPGPIWHRYKDCSAVLLDVCSESRLHGGKHWAAAAKHTKTEETGVHFWCQQESPDVFGAGGAFSFFFFLLQQKIWSIFTH